MMVIFDLNDSDWCQEGRPSIKEVAPKPPCMKLTWDECVRQDLKSLGLGIGENDDDDDDSE